MSQSLDLSPELAPPMVNGEVVFESPWQSRIFGMAVALAEQGHYSWAEFQTELIRFVGEWDRSESDSEYRYFDHFSAALLSLLSDKNILNGHELDQLVEVLALRPHDHDHEDDHDHSH